MFMQIDNMYKIHVNSFIVHEFKILTNLLYIFTFKDSDIF